MAVLDPVETLPRVTRTLLVDKRGAFLHKRSERLVLSVKGEPDAEYPLLHLEHVMVLVSGASVSAELVRECCERGIDLTFVDFSGQPYGRLMSPGLLGTVKTRRDQLLAYADGRGRELALNMLRGKLINQANLLKYMAKYRRDRSPEVYDQVRDASFEISQAAEWLVEASGDVIDDARQPLMVREAEAGRRYWAALRLLLRPDVAWIAREHRGAIDVVNSLLNYGYGILQSRVEQAVILAGLDPYAGFVHADRPGKPSMVLDLMEEFRAPVVDRTVISAVNLGLAFETQDGRLTPESRRALATRVTERLGAAELHEGKRFQLGAILQMQARAAASFLRGEQPYRPFIARW